MLRPNYPLDPSEPSDLQGRVLYAFRHGLRDLGYVEGAAEFERREAGGARDLARIFGVRPSCYGQPGNSWGLGPVWGNYKR